MPPCDGIRTYILLCGDTPQTRTNVLSGKCAIEHLHTGLNICSGGVSYRLQK